MKKISKLVLVIFSILILVIGIGINLLVVGWLDYDTAFSLIQKMLTQSPSNKVILIFTEVCMVLALLCIFVDTSDKKEPKGGRDVLMQNDNGKLMISTETIENIVNTVVRTFPQAKETNTKIQLDNQNNVDVLVNLTVTKDVIIKDMTVNMQNKIKEAIKKTSDLEVNEVNVRIKNIVSPEIKAEK